MSGKRDAFSVYNFVDYRQLLSEYCKFRRSVDRSFTIRGLIHAAGFTGPNYLKEVIDGKKNLSPNGAKQFASAMQLSSAEASYFQLLVEFNQGKEPEKKRDALQKLNQSTKEAPAVELARDQYALLANWHNIAVREYLHAHPTTDENLGSIGASLRPKLGKREVLKAVAVLERLKLISKDSKGRWRPTERLLTTSPEVSDLAARDHHQAMLGLAKEALDSFTGEERYFRAITGSFSQEVYQSVVEEINRCRTRILEMIQSDRGDRLTVYHIGFHLFPLEEPAKQKKGEQK